MSTFLDMLCGAAGGPIDDTMALVETRPEHRAAAIATGVTLGLMAVACPLPFLAHAVINLTANGVRAAEREARQADPDASDPAQGAPA
jgi:cytochrome c biogenesis protein CcdA